MRKIILNTALILLTVSGFSQKGEKVAAITMTKTELAKVRYIHELFPDIPKSATGLFANIVSLCPENKQAEPVNNGTEPLVKDDIGTIFSDEQLSFFKKVRVGCKVYIDIKYRDQVVKNRSTGIKVTL